MAWSDDRRIGESDAGALIRRGSLEQTQGNLEDAESLFRDALRALEDSSTPDDPALIGALNALGQLLVDRGAFEEAESLLTRALDLSEAAARTARKRIADLQVEAAKESRVSTPRRSAPAVPPSPLVDQPQNESRPIVGASQLPAVLVPWTDELAIVREEIESGSHAVIGGGAPWSNTFATRSSTLIAVAAGVVVLAALGVKQLGSKPEPNTFVEAEPFNPAARSERQAVAAAAIPGIASQTPLDSLAVTARKDVVGGASPPSAPVALSRVANAVASSPRRPGGVVDVRAGNRTATPRRDSVPARSTVPAMEKTPEPRARTESANAPAPNAPTSPTLIGAAPQPQYPESLRDQQIEGEVVVQFVVDETGRPDVSSMTVVRSPHALLTNAVRAVLPQFRFEPARTAPPQSIPRPETVRYAFTFRAPRR
ncbi:MAG: TonB family protein [Gemmatimonadaceae bacterium]